MRRLAMGALVVGLGLTAHWAHGATFVVDSTADAVDVAPGNGVCATAAGVCTLRAAVQEANALGGADAITLPAGTFFLTLLGAGEDAAATGDLDVLQPLTITGAGREATIIDGAASDRVFDVHPMNAFSLTALTVRNGVYLASVGGGVLHQGGAAMTLTDVAFRNNMATAGGAVLVTSGALTIANAIFADNLAATAGGAVLHSAAADALDVRDSTFSRNVTAAGPGGALYYTGAGSVGVTGTTFSGNRGQTGGALLVSTSLGATIADCVFEDSRATGGGIAGAVYLASDTVTLGNTVLRRNTSDGGYGAALIQVMNGVAITGCTIEDNQVIAGPGIGGVGITSTMGSVQIEDSVFRANAAPSGVAGALYAASGGGLTLARDTFEDNRAGNVGGAAYLQASLDVVMTSIRVAGNTAASSVGGGIYAVSGMTMSLADSTISDNAALGGIAGGAFLQAAMALVVERSTIADNLSVAPGGGLAGGLYAASGTTIDLRNVTVSGNISNGDGGGVLLSSPAPTIDSSTFAGNEATGMGAAILSPASVTIRASAIAATATPSCSGPAPVSAGDNVDQDGSCALAGPRDRSGLDPQLGPLQDNGGPTWTHEPLETSPLVDGVGGGACLATDQRGVARPTDGDGDGAAACDVGAVELVDECPSDPAKRLPGVCGCGVADVDGNANGAMDCLINAELKARIATSRSVLTSLTGEKNDVQTAARAELTALADGLLEYCTANESAIVKTSAKAKLVKLAKRARKALRAARKGKGGALVKKQKRGGKALDALDGAVAPQA